MSANLTYFINNESRAQSVRLQSFLSKAILGLPLLESMTLRPWVIYLTGSVGYFVMLFFSMKPVNVVAWCHGGIFYLQSTASVYMLIPGLGPLMIVFIGLIMWECAPCCSCRCRFSSGLRKLKPFLDVCEITREEFEQLFQEVIMIQIMSTYSGKSHWLVGGVQKPAVQNLSYVWAKRPQLL